MNGELCEIGSIPLPNSTWLIGAIHTFQSGYGNIHPYLAMMLCIAGTLMNLITVIVLTRPQMISPVNVILCAVAICDIAVMSSYFIFVVHFLLSAASRCEASDYSYLWAWFTIFHAHSSVIFHATSIWLTVTLAQIRVFTIRRATTGPTNTITVRNTAIVSFITCLIMIAVNLPNFLTFEIVEIPAPAFLTCLKPVTDDIIETDSLTSQNSTITPFLNQTENAIIETFFNTSSSSSSESDVIMDSEDEYFNDTGPVVYSVRAHEKDCFKLKMAFWSNGMIFKVVPCLLLTVSIIALLKIIADVSHRRKSLCQVMKKKVPKDHTTPMLVAVLSIFLLAELPQGLMLVCTGIFSSKTFHQKIYLPLGDFMDLLSLLNSAVNFLIYCVMSRKFRSVFFQLFFKGCKDKLDDIDDFNQFFERTDLSNRKLSSALTTNHTRTEQLSHYPSTASTLNASHYDHNPPSFFSHCKSNLLSVGDPTTSRRSSSSDYANRRYSTAMSSFEPPSTTATTSAKQQHNTAKRISFNLANDPPSSCCQKRNSTTEKIPAKNSIIKSSTKVGTFSRIRDRIKPLNKLGQYIWNNESVMLINDSTNSPQRRLNNIQTETNFVGLAY